MDKYYTKDTLRKERGDLCVDGVAVQGKRGEQVADQTSHNV
jgi:hypothetical protein